jgi:integrase/recombinase XerD
MAKSDLAVFIRGFFEQHLVSQRGLSGHTILAYRDAMKLLLEFASRHYGKVCTKLTLNNSKPSVVCSESSFLPKNRPKLQEHHRVFKERVPHL